MDKITRKDIQQDGNNIFVNINLTNSTIPTSNEEEISRNYVEKEVLKVIGSIDDFEVYRSHPIAIGPIRKIMYNFTLLDNSGVLNKSTLGSIGFTDDDIKFGRKSFKDSNMKIEFFKGENIDLLTKVKESFIPMALDEDDYIISNGNITTPISVDMIKLKVGAGNPKYKGFFNNEGFFLYNLKNEFGTKALPKYLYIKCSFVNYKNGLTSRLGSKNGPSSSEEINKNSLLRIKLFNDNGLFYYSFDEGFSTNYSFDGTTLNVNLYEIIAS